MKRIYFTWMEFNEISVLAFVLRLARQKLMRKIKKTRKMSHNWEGFNVGTFLWIFSLWLHQLIWVAQTLHAIVHKA